MATSEVKQNRSKLVLVGDCGCGKTAIIKQYVYGEYPDAYHPTGFDTYSATYNMSDGFTIQMSIWDTSGDAGYDRVRPLSYTDVDLILICFSVSDPDSLENVVQRWHPEVRQHCPKQPIILAGCKTDLRDDADTKATLRRKKQATVSYDQGLKTAKSISALVYSETTAKTSNKSVCDLMEVAALSSAGNKSTNSSPTFRRHRSLIRRKRFSGIVEAKTQLRKEAAKSCAIM